MLYTLEQNGVAERLNRTLMEAARNMISHVRLNSNYWGEAVGTAAYVRNRTTTTATNKTHYERWYGRKPDLTNMRVFGCAVYAHIQNTIRQKLDKKAEKMRFVGYSTEPNGYRLLSGITGRVFIRCDVIFNKADFGKLETDSIRSENTAVIEATSEEPDEVSQPEARKCSVRQIRLPVSYGVDEHVDTASCTLKDQAHHAAYNVSHITGINEHRGSHGK